MNQKINEYVPGMPILATGVLCAIFLFSMVFPAFADDAFIRGYAAAVLEREFNIGSASLEVAEGIIILQAGDIADADRNSLVSGLSGIEGVKGVRIADSSDSTPRELSGPAVQEDRQRQELEGNHRKPPSEEKVFEPLMADPRWPHFSFSYQYYTGDEMFRNVFGASFGETLPLYRDKAPYGGEFQIAIQAGGFIIHDLDTDSWDLINQDFIGGLAVFYRRDALSGLFSIYHNSTHIGDEFILNNDLIEDDRLNFSYEAVQLKLSYDISSVYRVYGGTDYLFSPSPKDLKPWFIQYGIEFRCPRTYLKNSLRPVAGIDVKQRQEHDWQGEFSLRSGIALESEKTLWHTLQFMLEYYNGNSPNGQFHTETIEYLGFGTHFYF